MLGGALAQVLEQAALHDAEQELPRIVRVGLPAAHGPSRGALHGRLHLAALGLGGRADVQGHDHVRPQLLLALDRGLRGEVVDGAVHVGAENDPVVGDLAQVLEAEPLETAAVGEDRAGPAHEAVQAAQPPDRVRTGAQEQVVGVREDDAGADGAEVGGVQGLDRALGRDGHERRGGQLAVRRAQRPGARLAVGGVQAKVRRGHGLDCGTARAAMQRGAAALSDEVGLGRRRAHRYSRMPLTARYTPIAKMSSISRRMIQIPRTTVDSLAPICAPTMRPAPVNTSVGNHSTAPLRA